jgi:hypothetical protein
MCIAILNTNRSTLKKQTLRNCWENNGDGAGMLYIDNDNKLGVIKEMRSFDNFYNNYLDIKRKYGKRNIVLHFRISTHGKVNETNCHPFITNDEVGFVHNGMIYDVPTSTEFSDTYMFNETILKNLKNGFETNEVILDMLEFYIGSGSKLIFLNTDNQYAIVNEKAGHWSMGCWFSNHSYEQVNSWVDYGGIRKSKAQVGFTPQYSAPLVKQENNWWSADRQMCSCVGCDSTLYGVQELNDGMCTYCKWDEIDEQAAIDALEAVDSCDMCGLEKDKFVDVEDYLVCETCNEYLGA